ncbi:MAG: nuclear transport factor 2 family protein [Methylophilaceae bacterium]
MTNLETTISGINSAFDAAFNSKNTQAIGQLYEAQAVVLPAPAGAPVVGNEAIKTFFSGLIEAGVIEHKLTLVAAEENGNLAFQRGLWSGAMVDATGAKQTFGGNVHLVYRKQADGSWKAVTHIWN